MSDPLEDDARAVLDHVDDETAAFIIDMALERARSQQGVSIALDQRITQASYLQLTGAAIGATLAGIEKGHSSAAGLAAFGSISFVIGAVICFRGVRSDNHQAVGLPPSWWIAVRDYGEFKLTNARCWAAGAIEQAINANAAEDARRARALNMSLRYSIGGALLTCLAAFWSISGAS
jgi:hypothetical protein